LRDRQYPQGGADGDAAQDLFIDIPEGQHGLRFHPLGQVHE
jgi:hypothetical protein